jgi:hypothetical protein
MNFNWELRVPFLYRSNYITLRELDEWLAVHMSRAARRRHLALLHAREGKLGVGSSWQRCESFHQYQKFMTALGTVVEDAVAIDYVWIDGPDADDWHDGVPVGGVPIQGSQEAKKFGIHANVGTPGKPGFESWHGQPIEIDGWASATGNGTRPAPIIDPIYSLPFEHDPYLQEVPKPTEETMHTLNKPIRVYDTRGPGRGLYDDGKGAFKAGEKRDVKVSTDAAFEAVLVNITIISRSPAGYITAYGGMQADVPLASNNNWDQLGQVSPNTALVPTHDDHIHIFAHSEVHVIVDLQGVIRKA